MQGTTRFSYPSDWTGVAVDLLLAFSATVKEVVSLQYVVTK